MGRLTFGACALAALLLVLPLATAQPILTITNVPSRDFVGVNVPFTYTITVLNDVAASVAATTVELTDLLPVPGATTLTPNCTITGNTLKCGPADAWASLDPGASIEVVVEATATTVGTISATASLTADGPISAGPESVDVTVEVTQLDVTKTTTPINPIAPNTNVTIEITISNPGEAEATGVVLTESLPGLPGLVATAIAAPAGVCNNADPISPDGATVTCELGDLASKDTITINITASAAAAGTYVAESSLTTTTDGLTPPPPVTAEIIIEDAPGVPALNISKTVAPGEVLVGEPFTYTITVENTGTGNATNVLFTDEVNATISGVTPDTICTFENNDGPVGTVSCTFVDPLAPAGTIEITITASTPNAGLLTNSKATVSADTLDPVPADPATVDVRAAPTLSLTKDVDVTPVAPNSTATFTLVASAIGADFASASLVDVLPDGLVATGVSDDTQPDPACSLNTTSNTVSCAWSTLAADTPVTIVINATSATAADYNNTAGLSAQDAEPVTATANVVFQDAPPAGPVLSLTKTASPNPAVAEYPIVFTLVAGIAGADATGDTYLTDVLPEGLLLKAVLPEYNETTGEGCVTDLVNQQVDCVWPTWADGTNRTVYIAAEALSRGVFANNATLSSVGAQDTTATGIVVVQDGPTPPGPHPPGPWPPGPWPPGPHPPGPWPPGPHPPGPWPPGPHPHPHPEKKCWRFNPRVFERRIKSNTKKTRVVIQKLASAKRWNRHSLKDVQSSLRTYLLKVASHLKSTSFKVKVTAARNPRHAIVTVYFPAGKAGTNGALRLVRDAAKCNYKLLRTYHGATLKDTEVTIKRH